MYKKITGVKERTEAADGDEKLGCQTQVKQAKEEFLEYMQKCKNLKNEQRAIKAENEEERARIKSEERMAKSFKFTKMSKKVPFLPSLNQKGELGADKLTSTDKDTAYRDHRVREGLIFPDKVTEKTLKFGLNKTCGGFYFTKPVGQEFDTYDSVMLQYMRKYERGTLRPVKDSNGETVRPPQSDKFVSGTNGAWTPNTFFPRVITETKPLLDRSNTPRGATRAITIDRTFSN